MPTHHPPLSPKKPKVRAMWWANVSFLSCFPIYVRVHWPDYLLLLLFGGSYFIINAFQPFQQDIAPTDMTIRHHYDVHEFVTPVQLVLICFCFPLFVFLCLAFLRKTPWFHLHHVILAFCVAHLFNAVVTNISKNLAGRPRPDFISRCYDNFESVVFDQVNSTLLYIKASDCTSSNKKRITEGLKSFFSGHSSSSFCGMTFLSLYLMSQFKAMHRPRLFFKIGLCALPYLVAYMVALSRVMNYRHHYQDVTIGAIVGIFFGYAGYRIYLPSLFSTTCDQVSTKDYMDEVSLLENNSDIHLENRQENSSLTEV